MSTSLSLPIHWNSELRISPATTSGICVTHFTQLSGARLIKRLVLTSAGFGMKNVVYSRSVTHDTLDTVKPTQHIPPKVVCEYISLK